jgi:hypothetical protein
MAAVSSPVRKWPRNSSKDIGKRSCVDGVPVGRSAPDFNQADETREQT